MTVSPEGASSEWIVVASCNNQPLRNLFQGWSQALAASVTLLDRDEQDMQTPVWKDFFVD